MALKTIKNIREEKWAELKSMAARHQRPIGELVEDMIDDYKKHADAAWARILHGPKNLTDSEALEMKNDVAELRKRKWFH